MTNTERITIKYLKNMTEVIPKEAGAGLVMKSSDRFRPPIIGQKPKHDPIASKVVGKPILAIDPKYLQLIVKWKNQKNGGDEVPDNFLDDPKKRDELRKTFGREAKEL